MSPTLPAAGRGVASTHGSVPWVPVVLDLPIFRVAGLVLVTAVALGILYVTVRTSDGSAPVYEDDDDGGSGGLPNFGPAYGATGTADVEEVLQVDDGDDDARDGPTADATSDDGFDHEVLGERSRGLLVSVSGEGRSAEFFVTDREGPGDPEIRPASSRVGTRHGDWTDDATAYLRDREFEAERE